MISEIIAEKKYYLPKHSHEGGTTKETHFVLYKGKKYILRICSDEKSNENCKLVFNKFKNKSFLPKLIEKKDNYFLIEFLKGRDLNEEKDISRKIFIQLGKILAKVNTISFKFDYKKSLEKYLSYLYKHKILPEEQFEKLEKILKILSHTKLRACLDISDLTADNCHIYQKKVYLTDIGAIKPKFAGFGITKVFIQWAKTDKQRKYFEEGYNSTYPMKFYSEDYKKLAQLFFVIQVLYYNHLQNKKNKAYLWRLNQLIEGKFI